MVTPITVPRATISMEQGKIVAWLKKEGDSVQAGDVLLELETDKAVLEVPAPADGILLRVLIEHGDAPVESVVGWVGEAGDVIPDVAAANPAQPAAGAPEKPASIPPPDRAKMMATPAARRRAAELGVDLSTITGSGPGGRITQEDVEAAKQPLPAPARKGLALQLSQSWQNVPHIHICRRMDAGPLVACRSRLAERGLEVTFTDLVLYSVASVLPAFPALRSIWENDTAKPCEHIHIGFAVDAKDTVLTPVLENANRMSLEEIASARRELTNAAREKRMKSSAAAVFTVTNLGMYGVDLFAPIIRMPETAMLAVGRVAQEPVVRQGVVTAGWTVWMNLAVDHRAADGAAAARFLQALEEKFEDLSWIR